MIHPPKFFSDLVAEGVMTSPDIDSVLQSDQRTLEFLYAIALLSRITDEEWEALHSIAWNLRMQDYIDYQQSILQEQQ